MPRVIVRLCQNSKNSLKFSSYSSSTEVIFDVALNLPGVNLVVNRFSFQAKCSFLDEYPVEVTFPAKLETKDLGVFEATNDENTQHDQTAQLIQHMCTPKQIIPHT